MSEFSEIAQKVAETGHEIRISPFNQNSLKITVSNLPRASIKDDLTKDDVVEYQRAISNKILEESNIEILAEEAELAYRKVTKKEQEEGIIQ